MAKKKLGSPELYINRELSWLAFNDRVLREGLCRDLPVLERIKFLAIVSSNLDEFFMIRVAGLAQQRDAGLRKRDPSGMTPSQQLAAISVRTHQMVDEQDAAIADALAELAGHGLVVTRSPDWTPEQRRFCAMHFAREVHPVLTPLAVEELDPAPVLPGLQLNVALRLRPRRPREDRTDRIVVLPVPTALPRFVHMPGDQEVYLARLEDIIAACAASLFPEEDVVGTSVFRVTRDADVAIQEDEAGDLLQAVEDAVRARQRRAAIRLELSADTPRRLRSWLVQWLGLRRQDVYDVPCLVDARCLWDLVARPGFDNLRVENWSPQPPQDLLGEDDLWLAIQERDILLSHPYESFDPVVRLMAEAADDPSVLAIKQTLYRTSGDSPIIKALETAAENGKQVTVLVELKARFDEARNVVWARRLEEAGCHVIYGIAGLKTHSKLLLIVRREARGIRRYVHLGTGNYNDKTAKLYADIGMLTCDNDLASDAAAFFNLLTGISEPVGWSSIIPAPTDLRQRFLELIDREIQASTPDRPGLIMAKVNSLQDRGICKALYRASRAGVSVKLNVRGICCLRPGVKGVSENIDVVSIIDRYLEHARIFYFQNGGHEEVYCGSADWMGRNLDRRLEVMFPVADPRLRRRLVDMLRTCLADNVKGRRLLPDGTYEPVGREGRAVRAQETFHNEAVRAVKAARRAEVKFQPLTKPKE